jgi:hypothetical protein
LITMVGIKFHDTFLFVLSIKDFFLPGKCIKNGFLQLYITVISIKYSYNYSFKRFLSSFKKISSDSPTAANVVV